jgi:hypothetical protein
MSAASTSDIEVGNAYALDTQGTGWFLGFSPWTLAGGGGLRHVPQDQPVTGLCAKWYDHPDGQDGGAKPISEGRTLSILVNEGAVFHIEFSSSADFGPDLRAVVLRQPGDYAAWGAGLFHRWRCERRSTVMTVRWSPA